MSVSDEPADVEQRAEKDAGADHGEIAASGWRDEHVAEAGNAEEILDEQRAEDEQRQVRDDVSVISAIMPFFSTWTRSTRELETPLACAVRT